MNKILIIAFLLLVGLSAQADILEIERIGDMKNFWESNGKYEQKVLDVGTKIINANRLDKRIPITVYINNKIPNAHSNRAGKTITIYSGILPYCDNDDELAYVMAHETAHSLDAYGGFFKWCDMTFNSKQYEHKADLIGIDMMVKAGYNPVAAICTANKFFPESYWNFGFLTTHPKTSKRLMEMYKYIYRKYPWALKTDMVKNVNYENFTYSSKKEIDAFNLSERQRANLQQREDL